MKRFGMKRRRNSGNAERGFTLTEMLIATAIILVGLVAVAQLVPASALLNANNRSDGTALVFTQRELEYMREQTLVVPVAPPPTFTDPLGCYVRLRPPAVWEILHSRARL